MSFRSPSQFPHYVYDKPNLVGWAEQNNHQAMEDLRDALVGGMAINPLTAYTPSVGATIPGADSSGVQDSYAILANALSLAQSTGVNRVIVPPGQYKVLSGLSIPKNVILELMPNATLNLGATLIGYYDNVGLRGHYRGSIFRQPSAFNSNIVWIGPANQPIIKWGLTDSVGIGGEGSFIQGIAMWGNGVSGLTGIKMADFDANGNGGCTFGRFDDIGIFDVQTGLNVFVGTQQWWFNNLQILNNIASTGAAISLASTGSKGGNTALWFNRGTLSGFRNWVAGGGSGINESGAGPAIFTQYIFEGLPNDGTGIGLNLIRGSEYEFNECYYEGNGTDIMAVIGSGTTALAGCQFFGGTMAGFSTFFKLYGFRGFGVRGTQIDASGGAYTVIKNYVGTKEDGLWLPSRLALGASGTEFVSGDGTAAPTDGLDILRRENYAMVNSNFQRNPVFRHNLSYPSVNVNANAIVQLFPGNTVGMVLIRDNSNRVCLFIMNGEPNSSTNVHYVAQTDPNGTWNDTKDHASTYNLYCDIVSGNIVLQNKTMNAAQFRWSFWELGDQGL